MLLFRSVCHQVSNQADKLVLLIKSPEELTYLLDVRIYSVFIQNVSTFDAGFYFMLLVK